MCNITQNVREREASGEVVVGAAKSKECLLQKTSSKGPVNQGWAVLINY